MHNDTTLEVQSKSLNDIASTTSTIMTVEFKTATCKKRALPLSFSSQFANSFPGQTLELVSPKQSYPRPINDAELPVLAHRTATQRGDAAPQTRATVERVLRIPDAVLLRAAAAIVQKQSNKPVLPRAEKPSHPRPDSQKRFDENKNKFTLSNITQSAPVKIPSKPPLVPSITYTPEYNINKPVEKNTNNSSSATLLEECRPESQNLPSCKPKHTRSIIEPFSSIHCLKTSSVCEESLNIEVDAEGGIFDLLSSFLGTQRK
mmetsp:Transcript_32751/g.45459  ORF Transcript_32751/g.45459 Transcript_32751/m.45459 type:complete len:261 (-) Transcript_32751:50-832(-)